MHNLFLSLVQYHIHIVLGINTPEGYTKQEQDSLKQDLENARPILSSNPTASQLQKLRINVLWAWCNETGMSISEKSCKKDLISAILLRMLGNNHIKTSSSQGMLHYI